MMPGGGNPKQMKRMMKKMGLDSDELDAKKVIIETEDKKLVFNEPQVVEMNMKGQQMYQVVGEPNEKALEGEVLIPDEDIEMVADRTGVSEEEAEEALKEADGEPAEAIIKLQS
ncbi:MAG: nascent polypeptide-associated complex protein [Candidatus Thermoplasmatota archaeon]|nr:nascent polypeptide-associated complex protein [Candidatus Thermoplasmatota archaeon]